MPHNFVNSTFTFKQTLWAACPTLFICVLSTYYFCLDVFLESGRQIRLDKWVWGFLKLILGLRKWPSGWSACPQQKGLPQPQHPHRSWTRCLPFVSSARKAGGGGVGTSRRILCSAQWDCLKEESGESQWDGWGGGGRLSLDNLSSIFRTHVIKIKNRLPEIVLWPSQETVTECMHKHVHTHTQSEQMFKFGGISWIMIKRTLMMSSGFHTCVQQTCTYIHTTNKRSFDRWGSQCLSCQEPWECWKREV